MKTLTEPKEESSSSISRHDGKTLDLATVPQMYVDWLARYKVEIVRITDVQPSPENAEIYGTPTMESDPAMPMLVRSIERLGLEEPIIVTQDNYILSGHRRYCAMRCLGASYIPVRFADVTRADTTDYHRLLAQYNPQRVKSVASVLAEKLLQDAPVADKKSWAEYHEKKANPDLQVMEVNTTKTADEIGPRQQEFLEAAVKVINDMYSYWPLSVRQIHYKLLNNPPLTQTTKKKNERWRYKNNLACYDKLSGLLTAARYQGHIEWRSIADVTRESHTFDGGYKSVTAFVDCKMSNFLYGYYRNRMEGQPNHVEVLIEKNTLLNVVSDICQKFHVAYTPLRGYGGPSVWREVEERWRSAVWHEGPVKPKCILIIVSDHDPEGLDLADDAIRSLRDNHGVDVQAVRPAVTLEQVKKYKLKPNPAKESSSRYSEYVKRTGLTDCWECEALDPADLRQSLHDAILSAVDVDQLNAVQEREAEEIQQINAIRRGLGPKLARMVQEDEL